MCECAPPPPYFDLPPPPDPSLIWRELASASENNNDGQRLDADLRAFERFFNEPTNSCAWLSGASKALDPTRMDDDFWATNFGGNKNYNRLYYLLSAIFLVLFMAFCAAIVALRSRSLKQRLKGSHRSSPSLNSSKLSTDTVNTATATVVASVGSGGRDGNGVATFINDTPHSGNNNINNNNNCRPPSMYHSATISRRNFTPAYCPPYNPQQQQQQQMINCCGCSRQSCCFDEQQRRIYSSQSATNIFGKVYLVPSQQHQQQQIHHVQCMNNNGQLSNFVHHQQKPQQHFVNSTVSRPRCAALRVQNKPPLVSLLPQSPNLQFLQSGGWSPHTQRSVGYGSATPYEYEEIETNSHVSPAFRFVSGDETDCNTTVFEDVSENLRQIDQQRRSQCVRSFQPPLVGVPPPVPAKRQLPPQRPNFPPPPANTVHNVLYQIPPPPPMAPRPVISPSGSSMDAELVNIEEERVRQEPTQSSRCESVENRTCDDATSLANSFDANYEDEAQPPTAEPTGDCRKIAAVGGRESGYGTGKSRRFVRTNGAEVTPPMRFAVHATVPDTVGQSPDNSSEYFPKNVTTGHDVNVTTEPPLYHHTSSNMTYV